MKTQYDFSKATRGKFFRRDAKLNLPIYLDDEAMTFVRKIAASKKTDITTVVNTLLHSDKRLAEAIQ